MGQTATVKETLATEFKNFLSGAIETYQRNLEKAKNPGSQHLNSPGTGEPNPDSVGRSLWEVLYARAKGTTQEYYQRIAERIRGSSTGQKIEAEVTRQKIDEILRNPLLWVGAGVVVFILIRVGQRMRT